MGAMAETKTSRARVAFALLCGLAVCCSVMYITADASESVLSMAEKAEDKHIGAGFHRHTPTSVESVDVKKAARIITTTPDGRERLMDFLNKVEKQIRTEVAGREADIAAVRAKMAKNMAYNAAARSKMGKSLLAKMAVNAKAAKDALDKAMRQTQAKFAAAAALENSRNAATMKRAAQTRALMRKNKAEAAKALAHAVLNHQRQLAALDQATNAKIKQTNKHIAANAAQIKENAKKARKDLDKAMNRFDNKMRNIHNQALAARSKLVAQANAQDAKFRAYANNRIKRIVASNAAKFREVRAKMAKDRSRADMAIKHAAASMDAALNANKALQDKRFASSVARLNAQRRRPTPVSPSSALASRCPSCSSRVSSRPRQRSLTSVSTISLRPSPRTSSSKPRPTVSSMPNSSAWSSSVPTGMPSTSRRTRSSAVSWTRTRLRPPARWAVSSRPSMLVLVPSTGKWPRTARTLSASSARPPAPCTMCSRRTPRPKPRPTRL